MFDFNEFHRRIRRQLEGNINYRKLLLILFVSAVLFLYIGPYVFSWLFGAPTKSIRKPFLIYFRIHCKKYILRLFTLC